MTSNWTANHRHCGHMNSDSDDDDEDDEIAYFTVRWKTRASFVYRTKTSDNTDKDSKNRKRSH